MKLFNFGYSGCESEYIIFTHKHNNDDEFDKDCSIVLKILMQEALDEFINDEYRKSIDYPLLFSLDKFYSSKRIIEEMLKLGYVEPEVTWFLPRIEYVQPNSDDKEYSVIFNRSISIDEIKNLLGDDLVESIIKFNDEVKASHEASEKAKLEAKEKQLKETKKLLKNKKPSTQIIDDAIKSKQTVDGIELVETVLLEELTKAQEKEIIKKQNK